MLPVVIAAMLADDAAHADGAVVEVDGGLAAGYPTRRQGAGSAMHVLPAAPILPGDDKTGAPT
jgi:hypothetical protein